VPVSYRPDVDDWVVYLSVSEAGRRPTEVVARMEDVRQARQMLPDT